MKVAVDNEAGGEKRMPCVRSAGQGGQATVQGRTGFSPDRNMPRGFAALSRIRHLFVTIDRHDEGD
jgi:hypothetical protein